MSGSVQWTEITSLVDYTICGPQIKLVLDGPCWSVAGENLKKIPKIPTDGWLSQHQLGFLFEILRSLFATWQMARDANIYCMTDTTISICAVTTLKSVTESM